MDRPSTTAEPAVAECPNPASIARGIGIRVTHAVSIAAPVHEVWPWLAQIGQDRGGFYSYEWLLHPAAPAWR